MSGTLHLIPVGLGHPETANWLPEIARQQAARLNYYVAENARSARAFLKQAGTTQTLQEITIHTLAADISSSTLKAWLAPALNGQDIGLVSEAGCPAVADPGARLVAMAHEMGIPVRPWTGPSSLLLALMASGLEGQRFAFHGYAPVRPDERATTLKRWETESAKLHQTQLLIETPYRNGAMLGTLLQTLRGDTRLCVARSLTTDHEWIKTASVEQWRQQALPELDKLPTVFLFLAEPRNLPPPSRDPGTHSTRSGGPRKNKKAASTRSHKPTRPSFES